MQGTKPHCTKYILNALQRYTPPTVSDMTQTANPSTPEIEAAAFRRLLAHLDSRKDVQNIDLMNQAGFCRNCLAKWLSAAAAERGVEVDYEAAREIVYGMPYSEWKEKYQR
jgi:hypothetical protein